MNRPVSLMSMLSLLLSTVPAFAAPTSPTPSPTGSTLPSSGPLPMPYGGPRIHRFGGVATSGGGVARAIAATAGEPLTSWSACRDGGGAIDDCLALITTPMAGVIATREVRALPCTLPIDPGACFGGYVQLSSTLSGVHVLRSDEVETWSLHYQSTQLLGFGGAWIYRPFLAATSEGRAVHRSSAMGYEWTMTFANGTTWTDYQIGIPTGTIDCSSRATAEANSVYKLRLAEAGEKALVLVSVGLIATGIATAATGGAATPAVTGVIAYSALQYQLYKDAAKAEADVLRDQIYATCVRETQQQVGDGIVIPNLGLDPSEAETPGSGAACSEETGAWQDSYTYSEEEGCCGTLEVEVCSGHMGSATCVIEDCGWVATAHGCSTDFTEDECNSL